MAVFLLSFALLTGIGIAQEDETYYGTVNNGFVEVDDGDVLLTFGVWDDDVKSDAWFFSTNIGDTEWSADDEFTGEFEVDDDYEYQFQGIASDYFDNDNNPEGWIDKPEGGAWEAMLFEGEEGEKYALLAAGKGDDNGELGTFEENTEDNDGGFGLVDVDTEKHWQGSEDGFDMDSVNHGADKINDVINGDEMINGDEIYDDGLELIGVGYWANNYDPYESIQEAVDEAEEGDTIVVNEGNYEESVSIDVEGLTLSSIEKHEAAIEGRIDIEADDVTLSHFKLFGEDEDRIVVPRNSEGVRIYNNILGESMRGIQGDLHGRPNDLSIVGNIFKPSIDYGIAGTEDIDQLLVEDNTFKTSVEGIGLGEGVELAENNEFNELVESNDWKIESGYAIGDYIANNVFVTDGGSIQESIESGLVEEGSTILVYEGDYEETIEIKKDKLTLYSVDGRGSTTITSDTTDGDGVVRIDADEVHFKGFTVDNQDADNSRAVRVVDTKDSLIADNTFEKAYRGIQGDRAGGTAENLTVYGNEFITDFGIASTEGIEGFNIVDNFFKPSVEGIGVGGDSSELYIAGNIFDGSENPEDGAIKVHETGGEETSELFIQENDFKGFDEATVLINDDSKMDELNATHNYWGQETGPTDDQVGENVDYSPWLLESIEKSPEKYDVTIDFGSGWTGFSFGHWAENIEVTGDSTVLEYSPEDDWSVIDGESEPVDPTKGFIGHDLGVVAYDIEGSEEPVSTDLDEGWNFVGAYDNSYGEDGQLAVNVFSPVEHALNSIFNPWYNTDDSIEQETVFNFRELEGEAHPIGGYWLRASEEETLSTTPNLPEEGEE